MQQVIGGMKGYSRILSKLRVYPTLLLSSGNPTTTTLPEPTSSPPTPACLTPDGEAFFLSLDQTQSLSLSQTLRRPVLW
ncbi:hypothetical protein P8452_11986 [Trifolium repens]|nr:hypothetical protein P8452_11986 [Trifolium repens]